MRARSFKLVVAIVAAAALPVACTQLIGADKDRRSVVDDAPITPTGSSTAPPVPDPVTGCAPGQKRCDGTCVSADDPAYGCSPTECLPRCSLPWTALVKCSDGACAIASCPADRSDCNGVAADGCEADLLAASTCGSCTTACGGALPYCSAFGCTSECPLGQDVCANKCTTEVHDPDNCGTCNNRCPAAPNADPACVVGKCDLACRAGFMDCDRGMLGCEPLKPYYADVDGDGFGAGPKVGELCERPQGNYAYAGSDCDDRDPNVKPGQTAYFQAPYTTLAGAPSYDYDCNGVETGDPSMPAAACGPSHPCH